MIESKGRWEGTPQVCGVERHSPDENDSGL